MTLIEFKLNGLTLTRADIESHGVDDATDDEMIQIAHDITVALQDTYSSALYNALKNLRYRRH